MRKVQETQSMDWLSGMGHDILPPCGICGNICVRISNEVSSIGREMRLWGR